VRLRTDPTAYVDRYYRAIVTPAAQGHRDNQERGPLRGDRTVQGKPIVRWGRKARDLPRKNARLPVFIDLELPIEVV
jgi:hypothetical protein